MKLSMVFICEKCGHRKEWELTEVPGMKTVLAAEKKAEQERIKRWINHELKKYTDNVDLLRLRDFLDKK